MPTFFVDPGAITPPTIRITGDLLHHLRDSLRLHPGDSLTLNDGCGTRYRVEVTHVTSQAIDSRIIDHHTEPTRSTSPVVLGQALIKGDKMDWVIQKATELGVATIVPIHSTHSVIKPNPERLEHQRSRWERIARDAAQQSERWTIPTIADPVDLEASEGRARGTFQRLFTCHHAVATKPSASDCLVDRTGRGMGTRRAASCTGARFPPAHPRTTNLAGRDRSNRSAQHPPIKTRYHSRTVKG